MFRASSAHLQEDTVIYMQHMVLSLCKQVSGRVLLKHDYANIKIKGDNPRCQTNHVLIILDHSPVYRVRVPYAACIQLYPPEDEHLRLETFRGK